ncbi:MAG: chitobiase/beta-hexosaminidase C-terminal domain-containing protein [Acidobacteriota bacterium]|nr:chitobiase/beta-hexosaminidase C-terminal domain-containing protein [Acidobacteriota bacterium]
MRITLLVLLAGCALACTRFTSAQAVGEAVQIDHQSMQGVGASPRARFPLGMNGTDSASGQVVIQNADGPRALPDCGCAKEPVFSVTTSALAQGTQVTITSPSPDAVIFYTTDGWTPTPDSTRYTGPVPITADTRLQAIAQEPQKLPSPIAEANYTVNGPPAPRPHSVTAMGGVLRKGTALRLVTDAEVASDEAQVGDRVALVLDEAVMDGDTLIAPKGTAAEATLTRVDPAGPNGKPGVLAFQVHSLTAHGITIPLTATLTLAAPDPAAQAQHIENAALVHVAGALPQGEEAEILPGMALTAYVSADTALRP